MSLRQAAPGRVSAAVLIKDNRRSSYDEGFYHSS